MEIKPLTAVDIPHIPAVISGYQTGEIYTVEYTEGELAATWRLQLSPLPQPITKRFHPWQEDDVARYQSLPAQGFSFGLYHQDVLVGAALAEQMHWNNSLSVWEFHIASSFRGEGWGRLLMTKVVSQAQAAGIRTVACETQNTNVPAIRFYRRMGFRVEGIDVSHYSNEDMNPDREVAVFMKRRLAVGR